MTHEQALTAVAEARAMVAMRHPFWAALLLRLRIEITDALPTAGTDGRVLKVNPAWFATLTPLERIGTVVHETAHCMYGHLWRRGTRDALRWNIAADVHCNALIEALRDDTGAAWCAMPAGGITAASIGLSPTDAAALSTEALYARDETGAAARAHEHGHGPGQCCGMDADGTAAGDDTLAREWQRATASAVARAKEAGTLPGVLADWAATVGRVRLDWRALLARWLTLRVPADYTWRMPARRWAPLGLYLPSVESQEAIAHLVIALDSSGSVGDALLADMLTAALASARSVRAERITLALWDTRVYASYDLTENDAPRVKVSRGGTDVRALFDWLDAQGANPSALVVGTDMATPWPDAAPPYPVLWLHPETETARAPFGEHIAVWREDA